MRPPTASPTSASPTTATICWCRRGTPRCASTTRPPMCSRANSRTARPCSTVASTTTRRGSRHARTTPSTGGFSVFLCKTLSESWKPRGRRLDLLLKGRRGFCGCWVVALSELLGGPSRVYILCRFWSNMTGTLWVCDIV